MSDPKSERIDDNLSVILLAAGSSSRLGQSKQLVQVDGLPLLLKSVMAALNANYIHVLVVLGANADQHRKTIAHLPVEILIHNNWEKGMGSSLKTGLHHIIKYRPETNGVVVMVCDQPLLTTEHLVALRNAYKNNHSKIVASKYKTVTGVPALFDQSLFPLLLEINDTQGARVLIDSHIESVSTIDWADGYLDIDTPEDLRLLNQKKA